MRCIKSKLFNYFLSVSDDGPYTKEKKDSAASVGLTKRSSLAGRSSTERISCCYCSACPVSDVSSVVLHGIVCHRLLGIYCNAQVIWTRFVKRLGAWKPQSPFIFITSQMFRNIQDIYP